MQERRKEPRHQDVNRVLIVRASNPDGLFNEYEFALTDNISLGGAKIFSERPHPAASVLKLRIHCRKTKMIIDMVSVVRWINRFDDELYELGVEHFHDRDLQLECHLDRLRI